MHSANWDQSYDYTNKNVIVIGTGASSVQIVPSMQPVVNKITVFQRSPAWILKKHKPKYYTPEEIARFENDREHLDKYRNDLWDELESMYKGGLFPLGVFFSTLTSKTRL